MYLCSSVFLVYHSNKQLLSSPSSYGCRSSSHRVHVSGNRKDGSLANCTLNSLPGLDLQVLLTAHGPQLSHISLVTHLDARVTGNSSLLAEDIDKRGEVYLGKKVPASHTNCMLSTVGVLITQINYFSYPTPCPEKNRPSQHWGTLKVSAQTLKPVSLHLFQVLSWSSETFGCN